MEMEKYEHQVQTRLDVLINENLEIIKGKKVGLVTNHTGVDRSGKPNYEILMQLSDVDLKTIFAPEHGFFGNVSRGQKFDDLKQDGFPVIYSLYGKTYKPTPDMFEGLDVIIYDIQDIGARFYTYISTLGLVMEAAAEADIAVKKSSPKELRIIAARMKIKIYIKKNPMIELKVFSATDF